MPKITDSLNHFIKERVKSGDILSEGEIRSLAQIDIQRGQPETDEDWFGVLWAIRQAFRDKSG